MMNGQGLQTQVACALLTIFSLASPQPALSAGPTTAQSPSYFVRITANEPQSELLAQQVADHAEQLRREIALDWLGKELPPATLRSLINIKLDSTRSLGRTLPTRGIGGHFVWIEGSRQEAIGALLAHEILHTVMADQFGKDFPAWANEGIASLYDSPERKQIRERILFDQVNNRQWPNLAETIEGDVRTQSQYTTAASLTQFLLERSSPREFLQFAAAGKTRGWDSALQSHYAIANTNALQQLWQHWVAEQTEAMLIAKADFKTQRPVYTNAGNTNSQVGVRTMFISVR